MPEVPPQERDPQPHEPEEAVSPPSPSGAPPWIHVALARRGIPTGAPEQEPAGTIPSPASIDHDLPPRPEDPVDAPRMYRLVKNREIDTHELMLATTSDGLALYAFTFVSCLVEGAEA